MSGNKADLSCDLGWSRVKLGYIYFIEARVIPAGEVHFRHPDDVLLCPGGTMSELRFPLQILLGVLAFFLEVGRRLCGKVSGRITRSSGSTFICCPSLPSTYANDARFVHRMKQGIEAAIHFILLTGWCRTRILDRAQVVAIREPGWCGLHAWCGEAGEDE
ncbi:hypothetical protein VPH35_039058 [Triticum aestivum]